MSKDARTGAWLVRSAHLSALFAIFLLAGCGAPVDRLVQETVDQTFKMEPTASFSIRNTDGSIRVYGGNSDELKMHAVKKAYQKERLEKIAINVTPHPNAISIETVYPPKPKLSLSDRSGTVDYIIVLPQTCTISRLELVNGELLVEGMRGQKVNANLVNGHFVGHNCFSDSNFFVANGELDIGYDWPEKRKISVDAKIVNGNLRAYIAARASFHVLATTPNGAIASEFTQKEDRHGPVQSVDQTIGGTAELDLKIHATNGSIRIAVATP
jgi:uncharacterized lipoprotein YajG